MEFCGNTAMTRDGRHRHGTSHQMGMNRRSVNVAFWSVLVLAFAGRSTAATAQSAPDPTSGKTTVTSTLKIVAFGDSLTAGYMLPPADAFPVVLEGALRAAGAAVEIINAGVSGDTSSDARERFAWAVPPGTDAVILELGANDALRGLDPAACRANLTAIIDELQSRKIDVLLAGMVAPRSMGEPYTKAFDAIYPDLARRYGLLLYPFFLKATALDPKLSLPDGLHPNGKGVAAIVRDILPDVQALIARVNARKTATSKG